MKRYIESIMELSYPEIQFVSLGPGDPELITLKGLKALQNASYIYCPSTLTPAGTQASYAANTLVALGIAQEKIRTFALPMSKNREAALKVYHNLANEIEDGCLKHQQIAEAAPGSREPCAEAFRLQPRPEERHAIYHEHQQQKYLYGVVNKERNSPARRSAGSQPKQPVRQPFGQGLIDGICRDPSGDGSRPLSPKSNPIHDKHSFAIWPFIQIIKPKKRRPHHRQASASGRAGTIRHDALEPCEQPRSDYVPRTA